MYTGREGLFDTQSYRLGCLGAISHMVQPYDIFQPVFLNQHFYEMLSNVFEYRQLFHPLFARINCLEIEMLPFLGHFFV